MAAGLRRLVRERAQVRCEYCLTPESVSFLPHEPDHIVAQKHGGATDESNLALCCSLCNKHKGTDLASLDPTSGEVALLYHPRRDRWAEHFQLAGLRIEGVSPSGRATVRLLRLNRAECLDERALLASAELWPYTPTR